MATRDRLALSQDERALQATLRDFVAEQFPASARRVAVESETGFSAALHDRLVQELGLGGLLVPEEHGGLGLTAAEASVVHAELGRALYGGPFLAGCLAATAVLSASDDFARSRWLPGLASGALTGTVAAAGQDGRWHDGDSTVRAERTADGWQLTGTRWYVLAGQVADVCVVPAVSAAGLGLYVAELPGTGFTASPMLGLDLTRRLSRVDFCRVPAVQIADAEAAGHALLKVQAEFNLATAAEATGGIGWCLDAAVSYAKDRYQFGRPIGSFQAVAHQCADMLADLQAASASARYAAAATAENAADAALATRVAVLRAGEAYRSATEATIHVLGGIGFTWEHDAHLYYRRAWSAQQLVGGAGAHRAAIADLAGL